MTDLSAHGEAILGVCAALQTVTGLDYLRCVCRELAALECFDLVVLWELRSQSTARGHTLCVRSAAGTEENFDFPLAGTPFGEVLQQGAFCCPDGIVQRYPAAEFLQGRQLRGYVGAPMVSPGGKPLGALGGLCQDSIAEEQPALAMVEHFAARCACELEHERREALLRERIERLQGMVYAAHEPGSAGALPAEAPAEGQTQAGGNGAPAPPRDPQPRRASSAELDLGRALPPAQTGVLPLCLHCSRLRTSSGQWQRVDRYFTERGEHIFSHGVCAECYALHYREDAALESAEREDPAYQPTLTTREVEVLLWVRHGKSSWEIGTLLDISESTVKFHVASILRKLTAVTRAQAVANALALGILKG